jgi:hypothetical protein
VEGFFGMMFLCTSGMYDFPSNSLHGSWKVYSASIGGLVGALVNPISVTECGMIQ